MREWFLKTEPSFDIGIFITLVISIIGFWHKGKKDKEESKKQKERYEKESEERFKSIEKQISMQKEVEKEILVRNKNIENARSLINIIRIYLDEFNDDYYYKNIEEIEFDLTIYDFTNLIEKLYKLKIELENLFNSYILYSDFEKSLFEKYEIKKLLSEKILKKIEDMNRELKEREIDLYYIYKEREIDDPNFDTKEIEKEWDIYVIENLMLIESTLIFIERFVFNLDKVNLFFLTRFEEEEQVNFKEEILNEIDHSFSMMYLRNM